MAEDDDSRCEEVTNEDLFGGDDDMDLVPCHAPAPPYEIV
jgi:hypothetical protein